jgi:hypothetical protein
MARHVPEFEGRLVERWKTAPMGGEMAFSTDPSTSIPRLAISPTEAVADHWETLVRYIRRWHWTALGWVSNYDSSNAHAKRGAAEIQSAFGYRFVVDEVRYTSRLEPGAELSVSCIVRNLGSAPFYYQWPVEVSLLDPESHAPVWKQTFKNLDIRKWLPGTFSDTGKGQPVGDKTHAGFKWDTGVNYDVVPSKNEFSEIFQLPANLPSAEYVLALAILDPAGNLPCVRFAIVNYYKGGRHPMGKVGVGKDCEKVGLDGGFAELGEDRSLHYLVE